MTEEPLRTMRKHVPLKEAPSQQACNLSFSCCHLENAVITPPPQYTYYMQRLLGLLATLDTDARPENKRGFTEDMLANYAVVWAHVSL